MTQQDVSPASTQTIATLSPGTYRVTVWHPRLRGNGNEAVQTIKIAPGSTTRLSIELR